MLLIEGMLPKEDIENIQKTVINNNMFPWYFLEAPVTKNYPCLTHTLLPRYDYKTNNGFKVNSTYYSYFTDLIERICKQHNIKIKRILRAACNLTWNFDGKHSNPHCDHDFPHLNIIFYLNKFTKGSTYLFKGTFKDTKAGKIIKEIKATKGKYAIFTGNNFHAAGFPSQENETRVVCIYTIEEKK